MNAAEQKLARLALKLSRWADELDGAQSGGDIISQQMRREVDEIKTMLGGDKPGSDWRRFIMEGFC